MLASTEAWRYSVYNMTGPKNREFDYQPPTSAAEYIDDIIDDSIAAGTSQPERRKYISALLSAMYGKTDITRMMAEYADVYATAFQPRHYQTYGDLPVGQMVFEVGSQLAMHSLTSAIRDGDIRQAVRFGAESYFRTEFGQIHTSLRHQQYVHYFGDQLTDIMEAYPEDISSSLIRAIDELYDQMPVEWDYQVTEDFLHGFIATDYAIKQYTESIMVDYQPGQNMSINKINLR